MRFSGLRRARLAALAVVLAIGAAAGVRLVLEDEGRPPWKGKEEILALTGKGEGEEELEKERSAQGVGNAGGEAAELLTAIGQFHESRTAPGIVGPGAYGAAFAQLQSLTTVGGTWESVTGVPYNADDPAYRDYPSNSSSGVGFTTGRITGLAADADGHVYAAGANGGVWRSSTGGGNWSPIADALPSLSSGALELDRAGRLWYATGEGNTGGTAYVGSGVYLLDDPVRGTFTPSSRVGLDELESTVIQALRFAADGTVWAATSSGIWSHSADPAARGQRWALRFAPNPAYLAGGAKAGDPSAPYKNIANDIAIDPRSPRHLVAAIGWRSGDTYNGFYESLDGGTSWKLVNPTGAINPKEIGNATFAFSADGSRLYAMNQSPTLLNKATGNVPSYLDAIYVSNNGSVAGPWSRIADTQKLANAGSALKQAESGKGFGPGIQAWYNQFLLVDPADPNHLIAGLEEVFETKNGGSSWTTIGPYWTFGFACWRLDGVFPGPLGTGTANGCPLTTHPDQHSAVVGKVAGVSTLFVGNDGGVYRRPLSGATDALGHATDWISLNDGTIDALQYYAVGVGLANAAKPQTPKVGTGAIVSGGLQDNGGSITRIGSGKMSSNFGGDGGDVLVDPKDGCNIVQEYVVLAMSMTTKCAATPPDPQGFLDPAKANTIDIAPPDVNARFIAPFGANESNIGQWLAGGHSVWYQDKGFGITGPDDWKAVHTWPGTAATVTTAIGFRGSTAVAAWCGPCNNSGFTRGAAIGTLSGGTWTWVDLDLAALGIPNRYIGGATVDAAGNVYLAVSGFSRRWTEGPGAGLGHIFRLAKSGGAWTATSLDGTSFPDIPVNSVKVTAGGGILVGTDLGTVYRPAGAATWRRLGTGLPLTTVTDVEIGPDGWIYASTHGRGIWRVPAPVAG